MPTTMRRLTLSPAASVRMAVGIGMALGAGLLAGCSTVQQVKTLVTGPTSPYLTGYIGEVVADEPRAALVARDILARGGNAADAATALALSLSVTLPSRASLGAGGACLAFDAGAKGPPEAILFTPVAGIKTPGTTKPGGPTDANRAPGSENPDATARPASVPMLVRGLFLLQTRHGSVGFDELTRPAAALARNGITVSRALADDLAEVHGPLFADDRARAIFGGAILGGTSNGATVPLAGDPLVQPQLADTLDHIVLTGVADLYTGSLANTFIAGANAAGAGLTLDDLRGALPTARKPIELDDAKTSVAFLPPPADGGLGAAAAFTGLQDNDGNTLQISDAAVAAWRAGNPGTTNASNSAAAAQAVLAAPPITAPPLAQLPASTSFVVLDRNGNAVSCALSMDNLFGTGRIAGDTGIVLGASPARVPAPLLAAAIAWTPSGHAFRAAVGASGQNQAAAAAAIALHDALGNAATRRRPATETGRANVISCSAGLPGDAASCAGTADPRGAGLAIGSN